MARHAATFQEVSVRQACQIFAISECCYRYRPALHIENQHIADVLIRVTDSLKTGDSGCVTCIYVMLKGSDGATKGSLLSIADGHLTCE